MDILSPFPTFDVLARFMRKYTPRDADECWIWEGTKKPNGYGAFTWRASGRVVTRYPHRLIYEFLNGSIPEGLHIDHLCRTRLCVNPNHLEAVTQAENNLRAYQGKCRRGHEMTDANVYVSNGKRRCRACNLDWQRKRATV